MSVRQTAVPKNLDALFEAAPDFELACELQRLLGRKAESAGLASLNVEQRSILLVWVAAGLIGNGGFRLLFEHDLPWKQLPAAFEAIGLGECAEAIGQAYSVFPSAAVPATYEARASHCEQAEHAEFLESREAVVISNDAQITSSVAGYARANQVAVVSEVAV